MSNDDVKQFYDDFLETRMVNYRVRLNGRLREAIALTQPLVKPGSVVADIGCGIGIVTEAMGQAEPTARVFGVDLSTANIGYAKKTVKASNVSFHAASVTNQFETLLAASKSKFDLVTLIDVIEHIPDGERVALFHAISSVTNPDSQLVLTYPSVEYLTYLAENDPSELQIIDNKIPPLVLAQEVSDAGWFLQSLRYVLGNRYIHVIFRKQRAIEALPQPNLFQKIRAKGTQLFIEPGRRKKYIEQALKE